MKTQYQSRPLREVNAEYIQRDIERMRAAYAQRGHTLNRRRLSPLGYYLIGLTVTAVLAWLVF